MIEANDYAHAMPPVNRISGLIDEFGRAEQVRAQLLAALINSRPRTLTEAAGVASLAVILNPADSHALLLRVARFVIRLQATTSSQPREAAPVAGAASAA